MQQKVLKQKKETFIGCVKGTIFIFFLLKILCFFHPFPCLLFLLLLILILVLIIDNLLGDEAHDKVTLTTKVVEDAERGVVNATIFLDVLGETEDDLGTVHVLGKRGDVLEWEGRLVDDGDIVKVDILDILALLNRVRRLVLGALVHL